MTLRVPQQLRAFKRAAERQGRTITVAGSGHMKRQEG